MQRNSIRKYKGAAIFRYPLFAALLFHALCGAQRSSASLPTDGAERALDFSAITRYNSGTRTPRSRYHIVEKTGKMPTKYKGIARNTTFVKFHRTVASNGFESAFQIPIPNQTTQSVRTGFWFGGGGRIRTIEAIRSRFTVCPLWPLGNSPIFTFCLLEPVDGLEPPTY